ncbi:hypothetical protein LOTGIDRAFT_236772 [Lottia gigantea]|uniref:Peptidase M12B domain-containing protein n=1 Tax=Lottia gigantea TaxID=225164 RepID=V3YYF3_LOTGI|nr:hypothetical protein LOTGIDRAFT_236772 [Lottia gigantea]ESO83173.1 hypothetical protein LOTGIDRAFT_236772 [Lottia gigantea]
MRLLVLIAVIYNSLEISTIDAVPVYVLQKGGGAVLENVPLNSMDSSSERLAKYKESRKRLRPEDVGVADKDPTAAVNIKGAFPLTCGDVEIHDNRPEKHSHRRRRRQAVGNHLVEFLLFLDHEIFKFWLGRNGGNSTATKAEISDYYANIINNINRRYLTAIRPGFTIQLVLAGLFIAETPGTSPWTENIASNGRADADQALTSFRDYVAGNRGTLPAHDHAQLVSGYDLTRGGSTANAGLAFTPSICTRNAVSVVEETRSQALATVMAHELAHSLGSFHDGDRNTCSSADSFIMDSGLGIPSRENRNHPWIFSTCSVDMIRSNLVRLFPICTLQLQGTPIPIDSFLTEELGQKYPGDVQCEIFLGTGSKVCRDQYTNGAQLTYDDVCYELSCLDRRSGRCFSTYAHDGTSCGNQKWCISGLCIATDLAPVTAENCPFGDDPDQTCTQLSCLNPQLRDVGCCFTCSSLRANTTGPTILPGGRTLQPVTVSKFQVTIQEFNTIRSSGGTAATATATRPSRPTRSTRPRPTQSNFQPFSRRPTQSNFQPFSRRPSQSNFQAITIPK